MDYISIKMRMAFKIRAQGLGLMQLGILLNLECLRKSLWYETGLGWRGVHPALFLSQTPKDTLAGK